MQSNSAAAAPVPSLPVESLMMFEAPSSDSEDEFIHGRNATKQAELDMLSEFTDDDTVHSSDEERIVQDHRECQHDPNREFLIKSVHATIDYMAKRQTQSILQGGGPNDEVETSWLFRVPAIAVALEQSSLFVLPPRMALRVAIYNVLHHWTFEIYLILLVISNAVFQACWVKTSRSSLRPAFATWVEVFYLGAFVLEACFRVIAFGVVAHKGSYLRDVWHWLDLTVILLGGFHLANQDTFGDYTGLRLLRVVNCACLVKQPIGLKIFAKAFLRSVRGILHVIGISAFAMLFFGLIGLQIFGGAMRYRCARPMPGSIQGYEFVVPRETCSPSATLERSSSLYWGHACSQPNMMCLEDDNPNYGYWSFDDIGHAFLSVFQVSTMQRWTTLMTLTSESVNTISYLYYVFVIIVCSWFLPSLALGIFMDRADKTREEFIEAQMKRYEDICHEKRMEALRATKISGGLNHNQVEQANPFAVIATANVVIPSNTKTIQKVVTAIAPPSRPGSAAAPAGNTASGAPTNGSSQVAPWSEEMRLQLHLSLTRGREVAEDVQLDRHSRTRPGSSSRASQRKAATTSGDKAGTTDDARNRPISAASRLDSAARETSFLDPSLRRCISSSDPMKSSCVSTTPTDMQHQSNSPPPQAPAHDEGIVSKPTTAASAKLSSAGRSKGGKSGKDRTSSNEFDTVVFDEPASQTPSRPQSGAGMPSKYISLPTVKVDDEEFTYLHPPTSAHQHDDPSKASSSSRMHVELCDNAAAPSFPSALDSTGPKTQPTVEIITIPDPEGGEMEDARSCSERWEFIRCKVHVFTESYPRIISRYLYDCARTSKKKAGGDGFASLYEAQAVTAMKKHKKVNRTDEEEFELETKLNLSPYQMALHISENASATWYHYLLAATLAVNSIVLATYHYPEGSTWQTVQWIVHVVANLIYLSEIVLRIIALGLAMYSSSMLNVVDVIVVVLGFIELGLNQTNAITCLRMYRLMSVAKKVRSLRSLRKVSRVLWFSAADIFYLLLFMMVYLLLLVVFGMNLFAGYGRVNVVLNGSSIPFEFPNTTFTQAQLLSRGSFNSFTDAAYAVSQSFSRVRDDWLLLTWAEMRSHGNVSIVYFVLSAMLGAYVFQMLFVAILAESFEKDDENDENDEDGVEMGYVRRFFDFRLFSKFFDRKLKSGFQRRAVAPDQILCLKNDMKNRLRTAEHDLDRYLQVGFLDSQQHPYRNANQPLTLIEHVHNIDNASGNFFDPAQTSLNNNSTNSNSAHGAPDMRLQSALNDGGQQHLSPFSETGAYPLHRASVVDVHGQRRLSQYYHGHNAIGSGTSMQQIKGDEMLGGDMPPLDSPMARQLSLPSPAPEHSSIRPVSASHRISHGDLVDRSGTVRLAKVREGSTWVPDRCQACGDIKEVPLKAPRGTKQRTVDELHDEQCAACSVRVAKQQVLNTMQQYVSLQLELNIAPTKRTLETLLGQAWSCGMMLSEQLDALSARDPATDRMSWSSLQSAMSTEQWLLDLRVGQEQIGRATKAYLMGYRRSEAVEMDDTADRSFFVFHPSTSIRSFATDLVCHWRFQQFNLAVIVAASIVLAIYDVRSSATTSRNRVLWILDDIFSLWFLIEMLLKCISFGVVHPYPSAYMYSLWNMFDAFIVVVSLASWGSESVGLRYLKVFRVLHLLVAAEAASFSKELRTLCFAVRDASRGFVSLIAFAGINYFVWTCFALHLFGGTTYSCSDPSITVGSACIGSYNITVNTSYATQALVNGVLTNVTRINRTKVAIPRYWNSSTAMRTFDRFDESLLNMFEISTGSWWLDLLYQVTDSDGVDREGIVGAAKRPYMGLFFVAYYFISGFIVLGLVAALMVYSYAKAKDQAGGVFGLNPEQRAWMHMQEFLLTYRPQALMKPLPFRMSEVCHMVCMSRGFDITMSLVVLANVITMCVVSHGGEMHNRNAQKAEYAWVALFIFETCARLVAHGPRTMRISAHAFDAGVVALSILQLGLNSTATHGVPFDVNVLRMLRVFRIVHAVRFLPEAKRLRLYGQALTYAVRSLITVTAILAVCVYVFAVVGMHSFGGMPTGNFLDNQFNNYDSFLQSLLMTFRVVTFESWNRVMHDTMRRSQCVISSDVPSCGSDWSPLYFAVLIVFVGILVVSMYSAVLVDAYVTVTRMDKSIKRLRDVTTFMDIWQEYDPDATLLMRTADLQHIFTRLQPPLGVTSSTDRTELIRLCKEYNIPDHQGMVHFHEVLIPLAKRTLAWESDKEARGESDHAPAEWKQTEATLSVLPVVKHRGTAVGAELNFAAQYLLAAYRRKQAMREVHALRRERWEAGRRHCDNNNLSYAGYAYHWYKLDAPFPEQHTTPLILQHQQRATFTKMNIPTIHAVAAEAHPSTAVGVEGIHPANGSLKKPPLSRPTSARPGATREVSPEPRDQSRSRSRSVRADDVRRGTKSRASLEIAEDESDAGLDEVLGQYRSAIDAANQKAFGPTTTDAIARHEKRSAKLQRRYRNSIMPVAANHSSDNRISISVDFVAPADQQAAAEYQPPLGTEPEEWRARHMSRKRPTSAPASR